MLKKHSFIISFLLFCGGFAYGQAPDFPFDKIKFLVGVTDEYYGGRQQAFAGKADDFAYQLVDVYERNEEEIAFRIDSLFKPEYPDLYMINAGVPRIRLFSASLSAVINDYYDYKPSTFRTVYGDTIYIGSIKEEKITTPEQKLSFLAGAFLRYGKLGSSAGYYFVMSPSHKTQLCYDFLMDLDCMNVRMRDFPIDDECLIYFTPSEKMRAVIKRIEIYRKDLMTWDEWQIRCAHSLFNRGIWYDKQDMPRSAKKVYLEAIPLCDYLLENYPDDYLVLRMRAMLTLLTAGMEAGIKAHEQLLKKPLKEDELNDITTFINYFKGKKRKKVLKEYFDTSSPFTPLE